MTLPEDFFTPREPLYFIEYKWNGKTKRLYGGSFFQAPESADYLKINLMAEYPLPCDYYLPIQDYSYPTDIVKMVNIFEAIKNSDKDAYVGCFGGVGRTGLFMSCFLKYLGYEKPLLHVRQQYNPKAVETQGQMDFLYTFQAPKSLAPKASF